MLHRRCLTGFWIYQGSEYTRFLNIAGFWICHGSEYTRVLNIPDVWIKKGSKYARALNIPGFWICQGLSIARLWICFWYWICQGCKYARITECFESTCEYFCLCLNLPENPRIYMHIPTSAWVALSLQRNRRLFSWRDKLWLLF